MQYFYPNSDNNYPSLYDFITGYEIKNDEIAIYYANNKRVECIPFNTEKIKEIENTMREQIINANEKTEEALKKGINRNIRWEIYGTWFMINSILYFNSSTEKNSKYFYGILSLFWILINSTRYSILLNNKEKLKELRKYKYFIENEDIINYELDQFYKSLSNNIQPENTRIGINDINNMTIQELKETVEHITEAHEEEILSLKIKNKH